jgi:hypothetical protein
MSLTLIYPRLDAQEENQRLDHVLSSATQGLKLHTICRAEELDALAGKHLLFAVPLGTLGVNVEYQRILARLRACPGLLEGCVAGLIVDGSGELYTKSTAAELTLAANLAGCAFVGRPLVEGTGSLSNFRVQADLLHTDSEGAYLAAARELVDRQNIDAMSHPVAHTDDAARIIEYLVEKPAFMRTPIVRNGNEVTVGADEATWKNWCGK